MSRSFQRHALTVSLMTAVSRVSGLVRDATLSRVLGAGELMDAFFFAFMIPNLFRRLFGEGALAAAFLPQYTRLDRHDPQQARRLASLMVAALAIALGGVAILCQALLLGWSALLGHDRPVLWLLVIMLPYMPLVCLVAMLGAMLQVHGRFAPTAAAPVILNLCMVAAAIGGGAFVDPAVAAQRLGHVGAVAGSVVVAGVIQLLWTLMALRSRAWWVRDRRAAAGDLRRLLGRAVPMFLGLGAFQINAFFDGVIASYPSTVGSHIFGREYPLAEGAMSIVSYAQRLYQFPLGVFGIAIATAIFPALAAHAGDSEESFMVTLRRGLRLAMFIALPASAGLMLVRQPLTEVVLQGGEFSADDARGVASVLLGYASAVWAYSLTHVLTRAYYARGDARTPLAVAVAMVVLNLLLNCALIWTPLRAAGLAWSTAICGAIQAVLLLVRFRRHRAGLLDGEVWRSWGRTLLLTVLMSLAVAAVWWAMPAPASWMGSLVRLLVAVGGGAAAVTCGAAVLRMTELRWALGRA